MTSSFHAEAALLYERTADKEDTKPSNPRNSIILQQKRVSTMIILTLSLLVCVMLILQRKALR